MVSKKLSVYVTVSCLLSVVGYTHGQCTYTALNTALNDCIDDATTSTTARWFFPHGTLAEQAELCQSSAQTDLATCINIAFSECKLDAKSLKMFGTTGDNIINAYTNLCSANWKLEAQACMDSVSSTSATTTFITAETAFKSDVTSLPSAATSIEICGLATTLEYVAYTQLLTPVCTNSDHRAVWSSFYTTILDTYVCTCSDARRHVLSHVIMFVSVLVARYFSHVIFEIY